MAFTLPSDHPLRQLEERAESAESAKSAKSAERWSEVDEAKFKEMQERRERVQSVRRAALHNAMANALMYIGSDGDAQRLLDRMIGDADAIRDALQPYDSGVRPEKPFINY